MDPDLALINFEFGTKQLSGNLELFNRLLDRFSTDYQNTSETLAEFAQHNNLDEMQMLVHTIKGVSGNLGLEKLQQISTSMDRELKKNNIDAELLASLQRTINLTIAEINRVNKPHQNPDMAKSRSMGYGLNQLIEDLQRQRFISDEKLAEFLKGDYLESSKYQALKDAIDQLDYNAAIQIVQSE